MERIKAIFHIIKRDIINNDVPFFIGFMIVFIGVIGGVVWGISMLPELIKGWVILTSLGVLLTMYAIDFIIHPIIKYIRSLISRSTEEMKWRESKRNK